MIYEKYTGKDVFVVIENSTEDPITHIGPKAFLSCKSIQHLTLPDSVAHIGDWAFAHMQALTDLTLPAKPITFGKKVFLDCENLQRIHLQSDTSRHPGLPWLLGAAVTILQDMSLLRPELADSGNTHAQWLSDFDKAVANFIEGPDEQGFEPVFYGWFNDEDADSTQLPKYLHKRRCQKLKLAFLRLRYDLYLQAPFKKQLQEYLTTHLPFQMTADHTAFSPLLQTTIPAEATAGVGTTLNPTAANPLPIYAEPLAIADEHSHKQITHFITWEQLPMYCMEDAAYIKIIEQTGILTAANIPAFLAHLQNACPEVIAYLLRLQSSLQEQGNFFDNFSL